MKACGTCGTQGHNARTCSGKGIRFTDVEIKLGDLPLSVVEVCYEDNPPLDSLVDALLRARGYGGIANVLSAETDVECWADRLYDLAEVTDCEELLQLCALAIRDPAHIGRLRQWAGKQLNRDQAITEELGAKELVLRRLTEYHD